MIPPLEETIYWFFCSKHDQIIRVVKIDEKYRIKCIRVESGTSRCMHGKRDGANICRKGGNVLRFPILEYYEKLGSEDAFRRMCVVLDALILNPDRHYGNFGVMYDTDTMQVTKMAPVFDHNKSLLPELDEDELARPVLHCAFRLGPDFVSTAKSLLMDDIRADLKNLLGFSFVQHPEFRLPDTRVNRLNKIVRTQIQQILY